MPPASDGVLRREEVAVGGQTWAVYAVGGSPAQAVQHGALELMSELPNLVVAGINYGENLTTSITISGTVGAALEGAALGIPALAVSLEMPREQHGTHSEAIDFITSAYFTKLFAGVLLSGHMPPDVDVLKVDVPADATPATPWTITRLSRARYYIPVTPQRARLDEPGTVDYRLASDPAEFEPGSDAYVLRVEHKVTVTPLSLDLTSRVGLTELEADFRRQIGEEQGAG